MSQTFGSSEEAELAFYSAFQRLDLAAMRLVWSDVGRPTCIHPGGPLLLGTEAIVQSWAQIFASAAPPEIAFQILERVLSSDLAVHVVEERIRPSRGEGGETKVLATNVYRRADDCWRMIVHHASLPLVRRTQGAGPERLH